MTPLQLSLLEHAQTISLAIVVLSAIVGALAGPRLAHAVREVLARRGLRALGVPITHADSTRPRDATLEGALEGHAEDGVLALSAPGDARDEAHRWRAPSLSLKTPIGRVALEGAIEVRGGRSHPNDPRVPSGSALRALRANEIVRVKGVLEPVAAGSSQGDGYRDAANAWRLVPGGEGALVAAAAPQPARARRSLSALVAALSAGAAIVALGFVSLALATERRGVEENQGARLVCRGEGAGWGALATLSPLTRRRATDELLRTLRCKDIRRADDFDAADRVIIAQGGDASAVCLRRAENFERATRFERAAALYETCRTPEATQQATRLWVYLARYDRASALARVAEMTDAETLVLKIARWQLLARNPQGAREALVRATALQDGRRPTPTRRLRYGAAYVERARRCALAHLDRVGEIPAECALPPLPSWRRARCGAEERMTALDEGAGQGSTEQMLNTVGREALRDAFRRRDVAAALRALRHEPPRRAVDALVALIRGGLRGEDARVRSWVETEFPHDLEGSYDAGALRWIAGAIDHRALLTESQAVMERQCAAERASAEEPALRALGGM